MNEITNRPAQGPKIIAFRRSPIRVNFPFPTGTVLPVNIAVVLMRDEVALGAEHAPALSVSGPTVSLFWTAAQIEALPRAIRVELLLGESTSLIVPMETANSGVLAPQTRVDIPIAVNEESIITIPVQIAMRGEDGVVTPQYIALAAQINADALAAGQSRNEALEFRNQAAAMVGNVLTYVSQTLTYLEVGIGSGIDTNYGVTPEGYPYLEINFL